jgi:hypothetical protein
MTNNPNYAGFFHSDLTDLNCNLIDHAVINGRNNFYRFNDDELEYLFFNPLYEAIRGKRSDWEDNRSYWLNDKYTYRRNKYTFRCDEFEQNAEFVFAGCSHTYGMGVPEDKIWGAQTAKELGYRYWNLGIAGASVTTIVNNLFAYFRLFGHPKNLAVLFPNFERLMLPVNLRILLPSNNTFLPGSEPNKFKEWDPNDNSYLYDGYLDHSYMADGLHPKFSKAPHKVGEVIPLDVPYFMATQSINLLEQYCELAGINLVWSIWDYITLNSFKKMKAKNNSYFKYMIDVEMDKWISHHPIGEDPKHGPDVYHKDNIKTDDPCISRDYSCGKATFCHKNLENEDPEIFNIAADNAHWGTHRHKHIGEIFAKHIREKYVDIRN